MNRGECDRCGQEFLFTQLIREWTGKLVCSDCFDHRHPQESVRGVRDDQGVRPNMRPEPADVFLLSFLIREDGTVYSREASSLPIVRE